MLQLYPKYNGKDTKQHWLYAFTIVQSFSCMSISVGCQDHGFQLWEFLIVEFILGKTVKVYKMMVIISKVVLTLIRQEVMLKIGLLFE
jgi:hypothetical protein